MKNFIKYTFTFLLSILATFYSNNDLNILFTIPLLAFFMFNGIHSFILSIIGLVIGSFINYINTHEYISIVFLLVSLSIYFFIYFMNIFIKNKIVINYLTSTIISIISTYFLYFINLETFDSISFIIIVFQCVIICFMFAFLIKKFSFYLLTSIDKYSTILLFSLICLFSSLICNIDMSTLCNYIGLFTIILLVLLYSLKTNTLYVLSLNSIIVVLGYIYNLPVLYENIYIILPISLLLSINTSKFKILNSLLVQASFILISFLVKIDDKHIYFIGSFIIALSILFISKSKINNEDNKYYLQYMKNKNSMIYQLDNFKDMFISLANNFNNSRISKILDNTKKDVFDRFCKGCSNYYICFNKNNHLLINYLYDYLTNNINENNLRYLKVNCERQKAYFTLLDSFTKTTIIKNHLNDKENKLKKIISNDFENFAKIMNQVSHTFKNDRLMLSKNFYYSLKKALDKYTFDILFVNDYSTLDSYKFDVAIKNISIDNINKILLPIINASLNCKMKIDKIDHSTLISNYYIISISEKLKLQIDYAIKQSNEDIKANGDSYFVLQDNELFYLAISDGMGCGINANEESKFTLETLSCMLKAKIDIKESILISNKIIQLKNDYESYTTLDLLAIDCQNNIASFFKLGAFNAYIIRNHQVTEINSYSLPLGIIEDVKILPNSYILEKNDIIVMCSDGMIDDTNLNIITILEDIEMDLPISIVNVLFSKLISIRQNCDDATLAVITIK